MAMAAAYAAIGLLGGHLMNKSMSKGSSNLSAPQPLPQAPSAADVGARAEDIIRKKRASATQSIYTSPLGVAGEADVARKTLLGQ